MLVCLQFDKFLLYPSEKMILCGENKLDIRGKDFEVLHLLLQHPKRLVRKDTFLQEIWPGVIVTEANIPVCIANIRKALGAYSETPLIETVRGVGYRLLADVEEIKEEVSQSDIQPEMQSNSALSQHHQNKASELLAQQYSVILNNSQRHVGIIWDIIRLSVLALSVIFLFIGALFYLNSASETFRVKPFVPFSAFFGMYLVIEIIHRLPISRKTAPNIQQQKEIAKAPLQKIILELNERIEVEKMRADQAEEANLKLSEDFKHRLGWHVRNLEIRVEINSYDGDCHIRWIGTGITKERPDGSISRFPGQLSFSTPGCSFKQYPVMSSTYEKDYKIDLVTSDTKSCEFYVTNIRATDNINMSYEYFADVNKAFCMVEEELTEQPYEHEWFAYRIISAVETLVINLSFPDYYKPTYVQPDAYIGFFPMEFSDASEVERIIQEKGFSIGGNGAVSLRVNRPKISYHYCVRWRPLPRRLVEAMKQ